MSNIVSGIAQSKRAGSQSRKSVLMFMAACASDDGSGIWTSKANIATDLEIDRRTVQRSIAELIEMGVVSEAGKRSCRNGFTVEYSINIHALKSLESTRATRPPVPPDHVTRATRPPQDVPPDHPNSTRTILEPSRARKVSSSKPERFQEFWDCYPHRDGSKIDRKGAEKKYALAVKRGTSEQTLIDSAKVYAGSKKAKEGYSRNPTTWLNQEGWSDELSATGGDKDVERWNALAANGSNPFSAKFDDMFGAY